MIENKSDIIRLNNLFDKEPDTTVADSTLIAMLDSCEIAVPVRKIQIAVSSGKAEWLTRLVSDFSTQVDLISSEWIEEAHGENYSTTKSAALKVEGAHSLTNYSESNEDELDIVIASDVVYVNKFNEVLHKFRNATTKLEIEKGMMSELGGEEIKLFKVNAGSAILGAVKDEENMPAEVGLTVFEGHKFYVEPLTSDELELYIYGVNGRDGDYPERLTELVKTISSEYELTTEEIRQLEIGQTLKELKQTNLGCRWPRILLQRKIVQIDGFHKGEDGFEESMRSLFKAMLGAPDSLKKGIEWYRSNYVFRKLNKQASLYTDMRANWAQLLFVDRATVLVEHVVNADCVGISQMAELNFLHAKNYENLTPLLRRKYIAANSPQGVWETSSHTRNIVSIVAKKIEMGTEQIVGWRVVRDSGESDAGGKLAEGRRLHIHLNQSGKGLGKSVVAISEDILRERGFTGLYINASGKSYKFFEDQGYQLVRVEEDSTGIFQGDDDDIQKPVKYVMRKDL